MFFESVQKLNRTRPTTISESEIELPESLGALFKNFDQNKPLPNLKGPLHPSQIGNQNSFYVLNIFHDHLFFPSRSTCLCLS